MYNISLRYFSDFDILYSIHKNQNTDETLNTIYYNIFVYTHNYL